MKLPAGQYSIERMDKKPIDVFSFDYINGGDMIVNAYGLPYIKIDGPFVIRRLRATKRNKKS